VVKIADRVDDNWSFLQGTLPDGVEVLDFFHASEHLRSPLPTAMPPARRSTATRRSRKRCATRRCRQGDPCPRTPGDR
jgi:hypothetical protein